ncbi:MAG: folate-binding protein, partial [Pseudomonadota bacterium]
HPSLGTRALVATDQDDAVGSGALKRFVAARIAAGVPEGSLDFALGDTFPHDANMDLTGGIDFAKGCFVGQEVVSRMRHRGTARRRTVRVEAQSATLPPTGSPILAGETAVGTLGTAQGREGLAIVRIDRTGKGPLTCAGVAITLTVPPGAPFVLAEAS